MNYFIHLPMKMEPIVSSETPGNYPKRNKLHILLLLLRVHNNNNNNNNVETVLARKLRIWVYEVTGGYG